MLFNKKLCFCRSWKNQWDPSKRDLDKQQWKYSHSYMGMILPTKCLNIISIPTLWALRRWIAKFLSSPLFRPNTNFLHYRKANLGKIGWDLPGIKRFYSKTEFSNLQYVCFIFEHLYNWFLINNKHLLLLAER